MKLGTYSLDSIILGCIYFTSRVNRPFLLLLSCLSQDRYLIVHLLCWWTLGVPHQLGIIVNEASMNMSVQVCMSVHLQFSRLNAQELDTCVPCKMHAKFPRNSHALFPPLMPSQPAPGPWSSIPCPPWHGHPDHTTPQQSVSVWFHLAFLWSPAVMPTFHCHVPICHRFTDGFLDWSSPSPHQSRFWLCIMICHSFDYASNAWFFSVSIIYLWNAQHVFNSKLNVR